MSLPVIVLGAGGHARVLIDALFIQNVTVIGITKPGREQLDRTLWKIPLLGDDNEILHYSTDEVQLVNGLGSVGLPNNRRLLFEKFKKHGFTFASVIHPSAVIASDVKIEEGVQIMAGVVIQTGSSIGCNTIVNTKTAVDHDCLIGSHVHLASGVTISGEVKVGEGTHVGAGTTVIQGINIGKNSMVGAGALVLKDVPEGVKVIGVPARVV